MFYMVTGAPPTGSGFATPVGNMSKPLALIAPKWGLNISLHLEPMLVP